LRSGLALAGAHRTLQLWAEGKATAACNDGILTADDISTLDLRNTWLVVLAACDTGLGEARAGEGVFGLRRGFIQAGAQNLLLTLWPIDDKRTRHLMSDFYTQLQADQNPSLALATVQRRWLVNLRAQQGLAEAARIAGPLSSVLKVGPNETILATNRRRLRQFSNPLFRHRRGIELPSIRLKQLLTNTYARHYPPALPLARIMVCLVLGQWVFYWGIASDCRWRLKWKRCTR
jgi:CHAT domain-containing protein